MRQARARARAIGREKARESLSSFQLPRRGEV